MWIITTISVGILVGLLIWEKFQTRKAQNLVNLLERDTLEWQQQLIRDLTVPQPVVHTEEPIEEMEFWDPSKDIESDEWMNQLLSRGAGWGDPRDQENEESNQSKSNPDNPEQ